MSPENVVLQPPPHTSIQAPADRRMSLCGIPIDALAFEDLLGILHEAQITGSKPLILNHNLHSLYLYKTEPRVRNSYKQATWVYVDGVPVVWLGRLAGLPFRPQHRITFLDCFDAILRFAEENNWRIYYLGSTEQTLREGLLRIRQRFPRLSVEGRNGYVGQEPDEIARTIATINAYRPHLLFVGMGMPLQEAFLERHFAQLKVGAALTSGATLDYVAGVAYRPPAWAGPLGLYGILRLTSEPRRLWRRYIVEPLVLIRHLGLPLLRQRWSTAEPSAPYTPGDDLPAQG